MVQLSETEYKATLIGKMTDVTESAEPVVDIWDAVSVLVRNNVVIKAVWEQQFVEKVYRNSNNTFDHVLLPTNDQDTFIVIVVNIIQKNIKGYYILDLRKEYGV